MTASANESVHALSGAYVVDALDDEERKTFERHLPGCLDCQEEVASLREAAVTMADAVAVEPPASLRASLLAEISTVRQLPPETKPADAGRSTGATVLPFRSRRFRLASLAAAAAVAAAVTVGIAWQPWSQQETTQLTAADQVLSAGDAQKVSIDFKDGSTASVYRSVSKGRAVILTTDMAAPPEGKVYEIWFRTPDGEMVPAGLMPKAPDNKVLLEGNAARATGVGITIEPEGGSKQPTSDPIAMFELDEAST